MGNEILFEEILDEEFPIKDMNRAARRKTSVNKAIRKRFISQKCIGGSTGWSGLYNNLHQYSKNKVHCSCWMCRPDGPSLRDIRMKQSARDKMRDYLSA